MRLSRRDDEIECRLEARELVRPPDERSLADGRPRPTRANGEQASVRVELEGRRPAERRRR